MTSGAAGQAPPYAACALLHRPRAANLVKRFHRKPTEIVMRLSTATALLLIFGLCYTASVTVLVLALGA